MNGRRAKQLRRQAAGQARRADAAAPVWEVDLPLGMNFECPSCGAACRVEVDPDGGALEGEWRLAARCEQCGADVVLSEAGVALASPA